MSDVMSSVMSRVENSIGRVLTRERSARDVLAQTLTDGIPLFLAYKARGRIPSPESLERIAVNLLAIVVATEETER